MTMNGKRYIQVILPLRLEWEPCYLLPDGVQVAVGDRVRVRFARQEYVGAVSAVDVTPQTDENRILPILSVEPGLPKVLPEEIRFWRAVSDYYLCSIGEVYKAAYPSLKIDQEEVEARVKERLEARLERLKDKEEKARREDTRQRYRAGIEAVEALLRGEKPAAAPTPVALSPFQETAAAATRQAFAAGKTVLLHGVTGSGKTEIYLKLAQETLEQGRSVLFLVPEIALSRQLEDRIATVFPDVLVFHSGVSAARRSQVASQIRKPGSYLVLGTRSALFLPHHNLGLIIVDEEHDTSYKQDAPAPR
ncbi:MAG: DEAD/DEAH box helicase family protein, partial [Treponema sp.]|nr:DEAD/DEAH box helicase family protein [Treponema sp.]